MSGLLAGISANRPLANVSGSRQGMASAPLATASARRLANDRADISAAGQRALANEEDEEDEKKTRGLGPHAQTRTINGRELTPAQVAQIEELQTRDREVRAHEQAHKAVGGRYAGSMSFSYQQGPDGKRYAVGGEVQVSTGPEPHPEQTIRKMQQIRRAALAPANPSAQDRAIAARASQQERQAQVELTEIQRQEAEARLAAFKQERAEQTTEPSASAEDEKQDDTNQKPSGTVGITFDPQGRIVATPVKRIATALDRVA